LNDWLTPAFGKSRKIYALFLVLMFKIINSGKIHKQAAARARVRPVTQDSKPADRLSIQCAHEPSRPADLEIGDTAGLATCGTRPIPISAPALA
jgi:hypothetical protein